MRWWACCRILGDVAPGLDPRRAAPTSSRRLLWGDPVLPVGATWERFLHGAPVEQHRTAVARRRAS
eukprot:6066830-Lingulodinium_polyedra.AAC.1